MISVICVKINIYDLKTRLNVGDEIDFILYLEILNLFCTNMSHYFVAEITEK